MASFGPGASPLLRSGRPSPQFGFGFTDFWHFPGFDFTTLEAHDGVVAAGGMSQLLLWIGLLEVFGATGIDQTLRGSGRAAGDFGARRHLLRPGCARGYWWRPGENIYALYINIYTDGWPATAHTCQRIAPSSVPTGDAA